MRFNNYLTEDIVSKALSIPEPKVGQDYAPEKAKRYVEIIDKALASMRDREENDTNDSIVEDLRDKKQKWSNVKKTTKPTITKKEEPQEPPPEEEPPPEQQQQQQQPPPARENTNKIIFESFRLGNKNSKADAKINMSEFQDFVHMELQN